MTARPLTAEDDRHGTYAGYQAGCTSRHQCTLVSPRTCTDAERRYQNRIKRDRAYGRPRKVPSIGSVRRIQALMYLGWSGTYLAQRLDVLRTNLPTHTRFPTMRAWKAEQITALYEELRAAEPFGPSERTAARARAAGFLPPEAWDGTYIDDPDAVPDYAYQWVEPTVEPDLDEIAIERAMRGDLEQKLTRPEQDEAIRRLTAVGKTPSQISDRLNVNLSRIKRLVAAPTTHVAGAQKEENAA